MKKGRSSKTGLVDSANSVVDELQLKAKFLNKIPDMLVSVGLDGNFHFVSGASVKLLGYTPEEMIGKPFIDFVSPYDRDRTLKIAAEIINGLEVTNFDNHYVRKDGRSIPVIWSVYLDNSDKMMYAVARDATAIQSTESLLTQNEILLNESQRLSKMGSWNFDFRTDRLTWSDALYDVFDVDRETFKETHGSFLSLIDDDDREMALRTSKHTQQTGDPFNIRYRITTPKGEKRIIEEFGYSEKDSNGKIVRLFGTAQDVTERVKTQAELVASEEKYRTLFDESPVPKMIYDLESLRYLEVNTSAVNAYGYSRATFLTMTVLDIRPSEDVAKIRALHQNPDHLNKTHFGVHTHKKKSGELIRMDVTGHRMKYEGHHCLMVICVDVTEKEKLQILYDRASQMARMGSWEINFITGESYYAPIVREIYEMPDDYVISLERGVDFYHNETAKNQITEAVVEARINGTAWDLELPIVTAKGNHKWVRSIGEAEFRDGLCYRLYGSFQDVTNAKNTELELKALNEDLKRHTKDLEMSNADLERFAYVASHDLQEPLRMISSFMSLLEKKYNDKLDDKARQYIRYAVDGAKRMRQIMLDLLEFSRFGGNHGERESIELNKLIDEFKLLRRRLIQEKSATIHFDKLPVIQAHLAPVTLVLHNLLDNALKYSRDSVKTEIWITVTENEDYWQFAVKDNGLGIEPDYFDKIFVIFQRLHHHEMVPGSGMGLAIAKRIVENYKGAIWLESKPNEGSTFYFTIPKQDMAYSMGST
jgi:PAS domain S-box-containing protein